MLAFQADVLSLLPSIIFASSLPLLEEYPILIVLYPIFLSVRGALGGLLCGKLSTALNVGWVEPRFRGNTPYFWALLATQALLSTLAALLFTLIAVGIGGEITSLLLFTLSLSSLTALVMPLLISLVAFSTFNAGLNPDVVLYPITSSTSDLLVTIFFVALADCLLASLLTPLQGLSALLIAAAIASALRFWEVEAYRSTVAEGAASLLLISLIVTLTGLGVKRLVDAAPRAVIASYAALTGLLGDAAGAFGSLITTRLAIGGLEYFKRDRDRVVGEVMGIALAYWLMMGIFAMGGALAIGADPLPALLTVSKAAILALTLGMFASFTIAIASFNLGLDPDSYVIPLESCLSDLITTYSLLIASSL
ncbi:MAG: hypothetical protein DRK00_01200 [Thermoprotei archaeon]|nr:MAG: hypothetical protein DRK00_01200 [Thermoprotei archaeon]